MPNLEIIKKILEILHIIFEKFNQKIWLTILSFIVLFLLAIQLQIFNINFFSFNMKNYIENHRFIKHKIEIILTETLEKISKNKKGKVILEVIPTFNQGTLTNPNYWGYVSYLMEWDQFEKKVVSNLEKRLKNDKVNIAYDLAVSSKIHEYATDLRKEKSIYLSVNEMINNIDKVRMEAMWRTETIGENGKKYYGNFDFLVEGGALAFILYKDEVVMQIVLIMDKEFYDNNSKDEYMSQIRKARDEIQLLFTK